MKRNKKNMGEKDSERRMCTRMCLCFLMPTWNVTILRIFEWSSDGWCSIVCMLLMRTTVPMLELQPRLQQADDKHLHHYGTLWKCIFWQGDGHNHTPLNDEAKKEQ